MEEVWKVGLTQNMKGSQCQSQSSFHVSFLDPPGSLRTIPALPSACLREPLGGVRELQIPLTTPEISSEGQGPRQALEPCIGCSLGYVKPKPGICWGLEDKEGNRAFM